MDTGKQISPETWKIISSQAITLNGTDWVFRGKMGYEQGSEAGKMLFLISCKDIPPGTIVGFGSNEPGPVPPIYLPPTVVMTPDFAAGVYSFVPADYIADIEYYAEFKITPPNTATLLLAVYYPIFPNQ